MAITERDRHEMIQALEVAIGKEAAMTLAEHLPPVGWADVATRRDLDALEERIGLRLESIEHRFESIEHRFESIEHRYESIEHRFATIDARFDAIDARFDAIDARWTTLDDRFAASEARVLAHVDNRIRSLAVTSVTVLLASQAGVVALLQLLGP